jgi:ADP-ribose pyrophosphatase YjhB (NUDIX family)
MPDVALVAGVILKDERGRYLLVQEAKEHVYGLWNWPAGKAEPGETLQETAIREAKEETGFDVRITHPKYIFKGPGRPGTSDLAHLFLAEITRGQLRHQPGELLDARWFSRDEIRQLSKDDKLRGGWVMEGVELVEAGKV